MLLPPYELHERIRVLRLYSGLNQADMAQLLGMTQSWLSKLESGIGELNASHLMHLRDRFAITSDCILDGTIPYATIAKNAKASLRIPKKYLRNANSRVRMLYGFVSLLEKEIGENEVREFFRTISVPTEIFADPNLKVNLALMFDLIAFGVEKGVLSKDQSWTEIAQASITPFMLGASLTRLTQSKSPRERLEKFCEIGRQYSGDFSYSIKNPSEYSVEIHADYGPTVPKSGKLDAAMLAYTMQSYHRAMLEAVARLSPTKSLSVETDKTAAAADQAHPRFIYHARWTD